MGQQLAIAVFVPLGILLALAAVFALLLAILGKKLAVKKDEREELIRPKLSGANCGGCGFAGCDAFAEALVAGKAEVTMCPSTPKANKEEIAAILGVTCSAEETKIVVACLGGNDAQDKYDYMGFGNCQSMELLAGGRKVCQWGCLGMGACTDACAYHAIDIKDEGYPKVHSEKCIKCGRCIVHCPKGLIKRIPQDAKVYVGCSNHVKGVKDVRSFCKHGCTGCGVCAKLCPNGAITMDDALPVIDYEKCVGCGICADKCPSKCIVKC